jgi:hypothetical protein
MNKSILLAILVFLHLSCTQEQLGEIIEIRPPDPASLRLVNQLKENFAISSWSMSGYAFDNLDIRPGESQQFILVNGMPKGYSGLTVTVVISSSNQSYSTTHQVNFTAGRVSSLSISECGGCDKSSGSTDN